MMFEVKKGDVVIVNANLIGTVREVDKDGIEVEKVASIHISASPDGRMAVALIPLGHIDFIFVPFSTVIGKPQSDMEKKYIEVTSGIEIARAIPTPAAPKPSIAPKDPTKIDKILRG